MHAQTITDNELVKQAKDGLVTGFEMLVRRYHPRCLRLATGMLNNKEEAQEAVQDAFVRVYSKIDTFRGDAKFSTWLYRILYNLCYTRLRHRKMFVDVSIVEDHYESRKLHDTIAGSETVQFENKDLAEKVISLLHELPERYTTVMHLYYIEDLTVEEIAGIMNISPNSAKVRLYRGRMLLRDMVTKHLKEEAAI